ncbi:MAG: hypothetical protein M1812_003011 [Candelaria pacifica]|nr:MAG: hypothetical protein M1812_003011 [Candelaria pacifica]
MPAPGHGSSSASPTPSSIGLKPARISGAAAAHGSSTSTNGPSNVALFVTNLRLLDLDLRRDWPGIDAQTFSTHNAQQNQKHRVRCVEWSLYRLFELWDAEDTRNKLQPFFPPLEPLQSLNLRAALFRCLSELKKNGVLGRETILRKTMLDECKGDKLEEVLLVFSTAVLRKVVVAKRTQATNASVSRRLATSKGLSAHEPESMIPLAIAHKASLTALLQRKRALRGRYEEFRALLGLKQRRAIQENEQLRKMADGKAQNSCVSKEEAQSLRRHFQDNWLGNSEWVDTVFDGRRHQEDLLLTTPFREVCNHVINGRLSDLQVNKQKGLLEDLEHRLEEQQKRLATWRGFQEELRKRASGHVSVEISDVDEDQKQVEPEISFTAHKDLMPPPKHSHKLPQPSTNGGHASVPRVNQEYERLITTMKSELANVGQRKTRASGLQSRNGTEEIDTEVEKQGRIPATCLHSQNGAVLDGHKTPTAADEVEALSMHFDSSGTKGGVNSPSPSIDSHHHEATSRSPPSLVGANAMGMLHLGENRYGNNSEPEGGGTVTPTFVPAISPRPAMDIPVKVASAPNMDEEDQDRLAQDIIARVTNSQLSPVKCRPTLLERTRMSMAFSSAEDVHQSLPEETPQPIDRRPTKCSADALDDSDHRATLLERTRQSMSLLPAAPHRHQKPFKQPRKSIYPTNQFETPQKQLLPGGATRKVTPKEDLFSQEADYASIFKSRPKIALSPTFSPTSEVGLPALDSLLDSVDENGNDQAGESDDWGSSPLVRAKARVGGRSMVARTRSWLPTSCIDPSSGTPFEFAIVPAMHALLFSSSHHDLRASRGYYREISNMPPFVARKRRASTPPDQSPKVRPAAPRRNGNKPTLFDTLDAKPKSSGTLQDNKAFIDSLENGDSSSSLSDISSSDFEDDHASKRRKIEAVESGDDEDDEEMDWVDAIAPEPSAPSMPSVEPSGPLELSLDKNAYNQSAASLHGPKKGPSKIERQIRVQTHCLHVQFLLFHNLVRNAWICDEEVQKILVGQLTLAIKKEFQRWKEASGIPAEPKEEPIVATKGKGKGKGKASGGKVAAAQERNQRDWGQKAERLEHGAPNLSRGDPLIRLMKVLSAFWKKKFRITAPGLRKQGYKHLSVLETEVASFQQGKHDAEEHGEKIKDIEDFREHARNCEGSRDVGAQLFTALLRGLGLETRMVTNLQPVGFGWSKAEDAAAKKKGKQNDARGPSTQANQDSSDESGPSDDSNISKSRASKRSSKKITKKTDTRGRKTNKDIHGTTLLSDNSSELSSLSDEDRSVVDITPSRKPTKAYDKDLPFPIYWSEVLSPISDRYIPIDALILPQPVATNQDHLATFEPRGPKADKAKQVLAYVVAYSADGTSKDVTARYLKKHMWPGKTKGMRIPVEKVPVYNKRGKVKRYEEFDWFKSVISGYARSSKQRTATDDIEDEDDLKPVKVVRKTEHKEDTLQGYKNSAEFVLERHLRREEALRPGSTPVKTFMTGKGEKAKEENVYRRDDVAICRTGESWHKEGREVAPGQQAIKMVPVRAVTLTRKREVEEAEREGGEKLKQGMYSIEQTEWIIPPPIQNGIIPKNAYGNIDCFVPTLVPRGAIHIPQRGTAKICKRLNIDFAEAVTGFEFGKQRAVPVINGVVVAEGNEDMVMEAWEVDEEEKRKKEEGKRERTALAMWRKFLMGLRIVQRVKEDYGGNADAHITDDINPFTRINTNKRKGDSTNTIKRTSQTAAPSQEDNDMAGGFMSENGMDKDSEGGFVLDDHAVDEDDNAGGFILDADDDTHSIRTNKPIQDSYPQTPISLSSVHQKNQPPSSEAGSSDVDLSNVQLQAQKKLKDVIKGANSKDPRPRKTAARKEASEKSPGKAKGRTSRAKAKLKVATPRRASKESSDGLPDSDSAASEDTKPARRESRVTGKASKATSTSKAAKKGRTAQRSVYFNKNNSDGENSSGTSASHDHRRAKVGSQESSTAPRAAPKRKAAKKALKSDRSIYFMSDISDGIDQEGSEEDIVQSDKELLTAGGRASKKVKENGATPKTSGLRRSTRKTM